MSYSIIARYGSMQNVATFKSDDGDLRLHDRVVLRTDRGTELGEIVAPPEPVQEGQTDLGFLGSVLRKMTDKDHEREAEIEATSVRAEFLFCEQKIAEHNLPMKLATVEHLFGGEKITFFYLADGRVDFRQLVKDLATEYRTRIEMRQIGVRDEARLLADYEHCGMEICCKKFIKNLEPVTMRMAKSQKTTLDPSKISGRCGRLMCCLRFEDETYGSLRDNLPRRGARVRTAQGWGEVVNGDILRQTVQVQLESGKDLVVKVDEILEQEQRPRDGRPRNERQDGDSGSRHDRDDQRPTRREGDQPSPADRETQANEAGGPGGADAAPDESADASDSGPADSTEDP